jgi:DNA-binding beta-propeller fold protein YncE
VVWRGQLAVPRAGETFFAVTANGPVVLVVDGRATLLHTPPADLASGPGYSQAAIYLTRGWHSLELRYAPAGRSDLRVLWQPPGSGPQLLLGRYLLPTEAPVTQADVPLPPPPELLDARLGDDLFALSANIDTGVAGPPLRSVLPVALPGLLAEPVWSVGNGCGAGEGQFASPRGVAVDGAGGRIYVADAENRRVVELALADGQPVRVFALEGFAEPVDVALDPQGALLVLDATAQLIFRIDRQTGESSPLALGTGFYKPRGLGVDAVGNIAVADTGGARVALLDPSGGQLAQFGGQQTRLGVGQPVDTVAVDGRWWALTAEEGRLWQLDTLGSLAVVERANTLTGPQLAALEDGSGLFVSDPIRRTVIFLAPTGEPLGQLAYPDAFANPMGVAAARAEDGLVQLIVTDSAACQVSAWHVRLP